MDKLTKHDKEDIVGLLEEYLSIFKEKRIHQELHKQESCPKCELTKQLLKKLKMHKEHKQ